MAKRKIVSVRVDDHTDEILKALEEKLPMALDSIGSEATKYAIEDTPVDSGRLRDSISWATKETNGHGRTPQKKGDGDKKKTPEKKSVYIGTNVEYAVYVEYGNQKHKVGKKHFLRDAMAKHGDHYKAILEAALKS